MQIRFLAVDGFNLIRRIFEARQAQLPEDMPAVVEAAKNSLQKALQKYTPSHAAMVLEGHDRTWRHLLYRDYKANRSPTPTLLLDHMSQFEQAFELLGVSTCQVPSYEADDVIGTIASVVANHNGQVVILSTDKVYLQLVSNRISVVDHFNDKVWQADDIENRYEVTVAQYVDYLALVGDKSNNVKGVPGIGPKSAVQLLRTYGDLKCVLATDDEDRLVAKVKGSTEELTRCRQLVQLKTDVELGRNLKSFKLPH